MFLSASAKLCIVWYLFLVSFFAFCIWKKYRFEGRPLLLSPWIFLPLVAGLTALQVSLLGWTLLPLALEFSVAIILGFIDPIFASAFFLSTFILKPWELLEKNELFEVLPRSLAALSFASLFFHMGWRRKTLISWNRGVTLFFCFIIWAFISALFAFNSEQALEDFGIGMMPVVATFLLVLNTTEEKLDLGIVSGGLVVAVLAVSSIAYVRTLWEWNFNLALPIPRLEGEGQWANANDLAALMVLALPLIFFPMVLRGRTWLSRFLGLGLIGFLLFGVWLSQSRGAIIAIALAGFGYFVTNFKLRPRVIIAMCVLMTLPAVLILAIKRNEADLEGSNSMRLEYSLVGIRMVKQSPLFGVGFGNYTDLFERYTTRFEEYGKRTAHSSWVLAMAETGIPGLFFYLGLFIFAFRRGYRIRKEYPEFFAAIISYGTCMTLLSHTYQLPPFVLYALIFSAARIQLETAARPTTVRHREQTPSLDYAEMALASS